MHQKEAFFIDLLKIENRPSRYFYVVSEFPDLVVCGRGDYFSEDFLCRVKFYIFF